MFEGFSEQTVKFMWDIRFNNNREWFTQHKDEYTQHLAAPMNRLAEQVYADFIKQYGDRGMLLHVSRIYRDARRLHGNGPYKDHLWFTVCRPAEEWACTPTFWYELAPDNWSYGLGYYWARPDTMAKHRARIDKNPAQLKKLSKLLAGQSEFTLEGESYKKLKGLPGGGMDEWYNLRSFSLIHEEKLTPAALQPELAERIVEGFGFLLPFYEYFSTVDSDPRPEK